MSSPAQCRFRNYGAIKPVEGENGAHSGQRRIGLISAIFIIFNCIVGAGIFATPGTILGLSGSVGLSLIMWVIGAIFAAAGMQVYIVWGTALPVNGGEKNYLEYLFRSPKYLVTFLYAANAVLSGWAASTSIVFGEYTLRALNRDPTRWELRLVAFTCITFSLLLHGTALEWGLRLQNILGALKIIILVFVIITGFLALGGYIKVEQPHNFQNVFDGTTASVSSFCSSLYNVIWSYFGFSSVNYALSEVKNPKRTVRIAGPVAIAVVTVLYILANIAYFAGATKQEITTSGQLVAALLFRNVYGPQAERTLDVFIAISSLGGVLSAIFSQGRVNQALGQEGILPFSKFWASNRPFNTPLAGIFLHWLASIIIIFILPPGDAYNFVLNLVRSIHIPPATAHHPSPSTSTGFISPLRHQRRYFLWHHLPFSLASRRMADGKHLRAIGSRLFWNSKRLPLCRSFCAPTRRSPAIYELTVLVACRSRMDHFWHRLFVLAGLGPFASPDWRQMPLLVE
ncbi:hypothetical protein AX14_000351 [Amanita brunnescens Koide BX004]|nr:hypothetical protein AX14_000351 [Amanita brunnescens Koide BX004]